MLEDRIRSAAGVLAPDATGDAGTLLDVSVRLAQGHPDRLWLLLACLSTALPTRGQLAQVAAVVDVSTPAEAAVHLLQVALPDAASTTGASLRVAVGETVVLVDHSARFDLHTGIQRVVRELLPRWGTRVTAVAQTVGLRGLRTLAPDERARVFSWQMTTSDPEGSDAVYDADAWEVVVPWRSTVVLAEVPGLDACERLACLGAASDNVLVVLGYDTIPVLSSGIVSAGQAERFAHHLAVVRHADLLVGISRSAAAEFAGFVSMLDTGPEVSAVVLPSDLGAPVVPAPTDPPTVLCVGTLNPRKNQLSLLHAAEQLWRRGFAFQLLLVAGGAPGKQELQAVRRLRRRPLTLVRDVSDGQLREAYASARVTVFTSLHEGYGLPVAESFAMGVPVITTSYGSTAELAEDGGALLVDPRDDDALEEALLRVLTDDALAARLRAEVAARPVRTWDDYAAELWDALP